MTTEANRLVRELVKKFPDSRGYLIIGCEHDMMTKEVKWRVQVNGYHDHYGDSDHETVFSRAGATVEEALMALLGAEARNGPRCNPKCPTFESLRVRA